MFSGTIYNFVLNSFDMTTQTREMVTQYFDILYAPTNVVKNIFGIVRAMIFSFGGRIMVNVISDPSGAAEEFRSISFEEIQDRITSVGYQNTWFVRFYYQTILILLGASVLWIIGDSTREDRLRKRRDTLSQLEGIHPMNLEKYISDLNNRIEAFESSCHEF